MDRRQRINDIQERQRAGIEAVLVASKSLLEEADSFSIERLETLISMRSNCISELAALDMKRKSIALEGGEQSDMAMGSPAMKVALDDLTKVDERLQDMMKRRQVAIINSMASMRNRVNFNNLAENPQLARQLLDITR